MKQAYLIITYNKKKRICFVPKIKFDLYVSFRYLFERRYSEILS